MLLTEETSPKVRVDDRIRLVKDPYIVDKVYKWDGELLVFNKTLGRLLVSGEEYTIESYVWRYE